MEKANVKIVTLSQFKSEYSVRYPSLIPSIDDWARKVRSSATPKISWDSIKRVI